MHPQALDPANDDDDDVEEEEEKEDILEVCLRGREGRSHREHSPAGTLGQRGPPPW